MVFKGRVSVVSASVSARFTEWVIITLRSACIVTRSKHMLSMLRSHLSLFIPIREPRLHVTSFHVEVFEIC
jgi:hypothetical protein